MSFISASSWEKIGEDEGGTIVHINFTCPNCGYDTSVLFYSSSTDLVSFETDQECPVCDYNLTIGCFEEDEI